MELGNSTEGVVKLSAVFPLVFLMEKPIPVDEILNMATPFLQVQDSFDLMFFSTIDQVGWWRWWPLLRDEHVRGIWSEKAFVED